MNGYAYCDNNPVNNIDYNGKFLKSIISFIKEKINFKKSKNSTSENISLGTANFSGTQTLGYIESMGRGQTDKKNSGSATWIGLFGKTSVINNTLKYGIGDKNLGLYKKEVTDILNANANAGLVVKDGFGVGAKAKASVLSGRGTFLATLAGWEIEIGMSADVLAVGAEYAVGYFPESGFKIQSNGGFGFTFGYIIRVKPPQ